MTTEVTVTLPRASDFHAAKACSAAAGGTDRAAGLEWARLVSCIGIVWFHVHAPGERLGYGGLPALMAISVMLAVKCGRPEDPRRLLRRRFLRLIVPWLFWSAMYAGVKLCEAAITGGELFDGVGPWMVLTGTSLHLWYLPYAFVLTSTIAFWTGRRHIAVQRWESLGWLVAIIAVIPICATLLHWNADRVPFAQWVFVFPAVIMGLFVGQLRAGRSCGITWLTLLAICVLAGCAIASLCGRAELNVPFMSGTVILILATMWEEPAGAVASWLASLAFGVYLVHPLCVSILQRTHMFGDGIGLVVSAVIVSVVAAGCLRHSPLRVFS